jgi:hypothetical protein
MKRRITKRHNRRKAKTVRGCPILNRQNQPSLTASLALRHNVDTATPSRSLSIGTAPNRDWPSAAR